MKYLITGGAGFLGSNLVDAILRRNLGKVTVIDNFSTGKKSFLPEKNFNLNTIEGDVSLSSDLAKAMEGQDIVFHLASNSDIARAAIDPTIDFTNGIVLTQSVLEEARKAKVKRILFTSGSGVYGDIPPKPIPEAYAHMIPISTYGAQKLASESFISAYSHMFDMVGTVFRFANVVGPNMTHGVSYDFVKKLSEDPLNLEILGDGNQSKPYIHVDDVIEAMFYVINHQVSKYEIFNVGTEDYLLVKEIADIVVKEMGINNVNYRFTGGKRGWKADVPVYRLDISKIKDLGWSSKMKSREAVRSAVRSMIKI